MRRAISASRLPASEDLSQTPAVRRQRGVSERPDQLFQTERPRLLGLAYRLLGGRSDAEDVVQEAWLRWSSADQAQIANPAGWLTTVVTRLAIDGVRQVERRVMGPSSGSGCGSTPKKSP